MRTIRTTLALAGVLALAACGGNNPFAGQASAAEVCTDVAGIVAAVQQGQLPDAQSLVEIEARLRLGVDDDQVQEAGGRFREEALAAADVVRSGDPAALTEIGPGLVETGLAMGPACERVGVPLA